MHQIVFYIMGFIKKLSLKHSFYKVVLRVFLTEFQKTLFVFAFQKQFFQNLKFFYFFFTLNYYFLFSDHFDALISKINFLK
jgi:hypothetical protein